MHNAADGAGSNRVLAISQRLSVRARTLPFEQLRRTTGNVMNYFTYAEKYGAYTEGRNSIVKNDPKYEGTASRVTATKCSVPFFFFCFGEVGDGIGGKVSVDIRRAGKQNNNKTKVRNQQQQPKRGPVSCARTKWETTLSHPTCTLQLTARLKRFLQTKNLCVQTILNTDFFEPG